jgi:hypothetical protein
LYPELIEKEGIKNDGWDARIRTSIARSRIWRPAIGRHPILGRQILADRSRYVKDQSQVYCFFFAVVRVDYVQEVELLMHTVPEKSTLDLQERIPFLKGRPERETYIDSDDLFNLRIALGLHQDVLDLYSDSHLFGFSR